jgi:anti-sigma factor RsiW
MDNKEFRDQMYQYLSGDLSKEEKKNFETSLEKDPLKKLEVEREQSFDGLIKKYLVKEEAPFSLRENIIAKIDSPSLFEKLRKVISFKKVAIPSLVGCMIVTFLFLQLSKPFPVFAASIDTHIEYLKGSYPLEIKTNDVDEAIAWFNGKMDFAVERPHLSIDKVKFLGARIIHLKGKKVAYFMYEKDGHQISAFFADVDKKDLPKLNVSKVAENEDGSVFIKSNKGYKSVLCLHKHTGTGCIFVSDLPKDQLISLLG